MTRSDLEELHQETENEELLAEIEKARRYTCDTCGKPGADQVYDRYNIYFGTLCEPCEKASGIRNFVFDASYAGERLEEEDY
jgi:hypothetical protein